METLVWTPLVENARVPAAPTGFWTQVYEYVSGPRKLKLTAEGEWRYSARLTACSPDGDPASPMSNARCLKADTPVGTLLGKIGGSTAGKADGLVFVVGSLCTLELDDKTRGALFLTINDEEGGFGDNVGEVRVSLFEAR